MVYADDTPVFMDDTPNRSYQDEAEALLNLLLALVSGDGRRLSRAAEDIIRDRVWDMTKEWGDDTTPYARAADRAWRLWLDLSTADAFEGPVILPSRHGVAMVNTDALDLVKAVAEGLRLDLEFMRTWAEDTRRA